MIVNQKVILSVASLLILQEPGSHIPFLTAKVSDSSQVLVASGLLDMVESETIYIAVTGAEIDDEEQLKLAIEKELLQQTVDGLFPWNSIWFKDFTTTTSKPIVKDPGPSTLKDRYGGKHVFDRAVQYKD